MAAPDAEYDQLARRLEELRTSTDPVLARERGEIQKKMADILVARRQNDRFQCHMKVDVKSGDHAGEGVVTSVGAGGGYARTTVALERFADVTLTINTPGRLAKGTVLTATVRWVKANEGVGIAFKDLDPKVAEQVKKVLGELLRDQPPPGALEP